MFLVFPPLFLLAHNSYACSAAGTIALSALHIMQALVFSCYGLAYKNAYEINNQIVSMPQLNLFHIQQLHNAVSQSSTVNDSALQSSLTRVMPLQAYKPIFTQKGCNGYGVGLFKFQSRVHQPTPSFSIQQLKPPLITDEYKLYADVVSSVAMPDNVSIKFRVGDQQLQLGPVDIRFDAMRSLFSNAEIFLAQAQNLDFLDSKLLAISQSPIIHAYINAATELFHTTIVSGVGPARAINFVNNITQLYDSITNIIDSVDCAQAAALADIRQAVRSLIHVSHSKHGDFLGIVTANQKQAVTDIYARMLGELTLGGFEQTLNARIAAGADYLVPSRDFYFPKGWSKVLYVPLNTLRESFSVRSINVASAWHHGESISVKIRESSLYKAMLKVEALVQHGLIDAASRVVEDFNPALKETRHAYEINFYNTLKEFFEICKGRSLNEYGIPKIFEIHPHWDAIKHALASNSVIKSEVLWRLELDQAFVIKLLQRLGLTCPTDAELKLIYTLSGFSDLHCFDQAVGGIVSISDVQITIDYLFACRAECEAIRNILLDFGFTQPQFEHYMPNLIRFAQDHQFIPLLKVLKEQSGEISDFLKIMSEREKALTLLLSRVGIYAPSQIEKQICYQLIDVMHDKFQILELLNCLDPRHPDSSIRGAYHNFFDSIGIQKILPVDNKIRELIQGKFEVINLHEDPQMRLSANRLAIFSIKGPEELHIIERGFDYIAQGCSSALHAQVIRDYVICYVRELVHPSEMSATILSLAELIDTYRQPIPDEIRGMFRQTFFGICDLRLPLEERLHLMQVLRNASAHIQNKNLAPARDLLYISTLRMGGNSNVDQNNISRQKLVDVSPTATSSIKIQSQSKGASQYAALVLLDPLKAYQQIGSTGIKSKEPYGYKNRLDVACPKLLPRYVPEKPNSKFKSKDPYLRARWMLKEGKLVAFAQDGVVVFVDDIFVHIATDGSVTSILPQPKQIGKYRRDVEYLVHRLAGQITQNSLVSAAQEDGFLTHVRTPNLADRADMGSDSSIVSQPADEENIFGQTYVSIEEIPLESTRMDIQALELVGLITGNQRITSQFRILRRSLSDSDLRIQEPDFDFITHLAKERAKQSRQSSHAACSSSGGGMPPDDPRNNRNRWDSRPREIDDSSKHPYGKYVDAPYHNRMYGNSVKSKAPIDGQEALNISIPLEGTSRRISLCKGEFVVLDETRIGEYHGHVRDYAGLTQVMKNALQEAGLINHRGKIICK